MWDSGGNEGGPQGSGAGVTWGVILPVNSSSLDGTVVRYITGSGFPTNDPALSLTIGDLVVSNLAVAPNASLLTFTIPAPSQNPNNALVAGTHYDIVLRTSNGVQVATFPKSYVFFSPNSAAGGAGVTWGVILPVNSSSLDGTVVRYITGSGFPTNDPALYLTIGDLVVSNLAVAPNASLLTFTIPAPSQNPNNALVAGPEP
eukprot:tig00021221_g19339.t1